jgi:hypothetical protein
LPSAAVISAVALMAPSFAAQAATKPCDVMPERCRYGPDGIFYFYPPGYRMPTENGAPVGPRRTPGRTASLGASRGSAVQAWGCDVTDGKTTGRSSGFRNRTAASLGALDACMQTSNAGDCRIVGCSATVKTHYDAHVTWLKAAPARRSSKD